MTNSVLKSISTFTIYANTFIDISTVQKNQSKFESLLAKGKECDLETFIIESRVRPAFTTFLPHCFEEKQIVGHELKVFIQTEIRLSFLCVSVTLQFIPKSSLTIDQTFGFIEKIKKIAREKLRE